MKTSKKTSLPSERMLADFLARFTPEIGSLAQSLLHKMSELLPGAIRLVYENYNALVVGFGPSERTSEAVVSLAIYPRWVNLCFLHGATLPDPSHILNGNGKQVRTVRLDRPEALDSEELRALIASAVRQSGASLQGRSSRLVIRAAAERTRDRRPAPPARKRASTNDRLREKPDTPARDGVSSLRLEISAAAGSNLVPFLRRHLRAAHAELRPRLAELSLALVGDKAMADLHQRFMGIAGPTDVLTFPLDEDPRGRVTAGEVVVCIPEARRRAKAEGTELRHEVLLYALHGMLHLCGYDDLKPADFRRMHQTEDRILAAIGIGAVFHRAVKADLAKPSKPVRGAAAPRAKAKQRSANSPAR